MRAAVLFAALLPAVALGAPAKRVADAVERGEDPRKDAQVDRQTDCQVRGVGGICLDDFIHDHILPKYDPDWLACMDDPLCPDIGPPYASAAGKTDLGVDNHKKVDDTQLSSRSKQDSASTQDKAIVFPPPTAPFLNINMTKAIESLHNFRWSATCGDWLSSLPCPASLPVDVESTHVKRGFWDWLVGDHTHDNEDKDGDDSWGGDMIAGHFKRDDAKAGIAHSPATVTVTVQEPSVLPSAMIQGRQGLPTTLITQRPSGLREITHSPHTVTVTVQAPSVVPSAMMQRLSGLPTTMMQSRPVLPSTMIQSPPRIPTTKMCFPWVRPSAMPEPERPSRLPSAMTQGPPVPLSAMTQMPTALPSGMTQMPTALPSGMIQNQPIAPSAMSAMSRPTALPSKIREMKPSVYASAMAAIPVGDAAAMVNCLGDIDCVRKAAIMQDVAKKGYISKINQMLIDEIERQKNH